jgi:O-antigen ligase
VAGRLPGTATPDLGARLLELGLAAGLILAPFPLGAVHEQGRLALEIGAGLLLALWLLRALLRPTPLPSRLVSAGLAGLLGLALLQLLPLGSTVVGAISPQALTIRSASETPTASRAVEQRLIGVDPAALDRKATLSLDPAGTASALRTGAAIVTAFLVATTVAATCGARRIALALLLGAAFQGLYGLLTVASGHDRIWHLVKEHYLYAATGTFVNPNHFGALLAMSLPCGLALILVQARDRRPRGDAGRLAAWFSAEGSRSWLLGMLLAIGAAGMLLSYSRAAVAFTSFVLLLTLFGAGRRSGGHARIVVALAVAAIAATPLMQIGVERLIERYADVHEELSGARVRVWIDSLSLVRDFPVTGCGFGAFAASYPLVRSPEIRYFFAHAHNEPVQLLAEGGIVGLILVLMVAVPVARTALAAIRGAKGRLAVGFAAGLVAVALHAIIDFNFHIPSNAVVSAVLAGTLLGLPWVRRS